MSHPARDPRSGIDGKANAASRRHAESEMSSIIAEAVA